MVSRLEVDRLRISQSVAALTAGSQRRYPPKLRATIAEYARARLQAGGPRKSVVQELGVSDPTLVRFLAESPRVGELRPVRLIAPIPVASPPPVVVRTAGGLLVEGLDIAGVAALVRALA
jgi:hypothetical protein